MIRRMYRELCIATLLSATLVLTAAVDILTPGQSLANNDSLTSAERYFVLGFFTAGSKKQRYLGIWYDRIPVQTVVWVANRGRPLPAASTASLTISRNGRLVLADAAGTVYWSTAPALGSPVARLLDNGNLVLLHDQSSTTRYAWESFANPFDTMLPGMRLGLNRRTGEALSLTAWGSHDDPAPGAFTWGLQTRGVPQLFTMNRSNPLWRGGPWVGDRFTGVPDMKSNNVFSYGFTGESDDSGDLFFTYEVWNKSVLYRIVMNTSGVAEHVMWDEAYRSWVSLWSSESDACDKFDACGPYGLCDTARSPGVCGCVEGFEPSEPVEWDRGVTAGGCRRRTPLDCREDAFVVVAGVKLPDTSVGTRENSVGLEECRAGCVRNCSCTAFSSGDGIGYIRWFGELTDLRVYNSSGGKDLYVRVAGQGQGGKDQKKVMIIIIVLIISFVVILSILIYLCRRRRKNKYRLKEMQHVVGEQLHEECDKGNDLELPLFHFNTLQFATNNFSFQNKLGEGGYGPVYKGKMPDGQFVAIKRLSKDSTQGLEQFKSEVQLVAKLQHTNLVRLLGCCIENEEKILVYEYMANQSLEKFIFDADGARKLDWGKRLHIIEGITQGLLYLHKYSRLRVIHRDLKASNILLDDEWNPKISDFGMARIFSWNEPQENTKRIVGTYGYMPPEYAMKGLFSVKSDVYSFGVLLLEILSGKKSTSIYHFGTTLNLSGHAWELWRERRELELMDPSMGNSVPRNEFARFIHVALLCVQDNPLDRPTMLDIISWFNSEISLPTPNHPAFILVRHTIEEGNNIDIEQFSSSNGVTISRIEGR